MKLVIQNGGLRSVPERRRPKRLPHVHDRQANFLAFFGPQPGVEFIQARFRTIPAAKPDRSSFQQIADYDTVAVPLPHRKLVDANDRWVRSGSTPELLAHI